MAPDPKRATLQDWLDLHQITPDQVRNLVAMSGPDAPPLARDPGLDGEPPWPRVLHDLGRALPQALPVLAHVADHVRVDLAPDTARFPRAFTLHDDGRGQPFISCPLTGRVSDLLTLAHELGHACQIIASGRADLPPVHRETAACLVERLMIAGRALTLPDSAALLLALHRQQGARAMATHGKAVLAALHTPGSPYHYGWNYPIARVLAAHAATQFTADLQWQVFTGAVTLPEMINSVPVT